MRPEDEELIHAAIVRLRARVLALATGMMGGALLFLATAVLLIRGGENVGQHLRLLRYFCPGFDVTWPGAFVGLFYGLVYGAVLGFAVAWVHNRVVERRRRKRSAAS